MECLHLLGFAKKRELYLVRDPMGEKPLYWAKIQDKVYFSSEMKSFFEIEEFTKNQI